MKPKPPKINTLQKQNKTTRRLRTGSDVTKAHPNVEHQRNQQKTIWTHWTKPAQLRQTAPANFYIINLHFRTVNQTETSWIHAGLFVLLVDEWEAEALWSHFQTPETIQPVLEANDAGCVDNFLWQGIPLIYDSHTETVCPYGCVASLLEQL